MQKVSTNLSNDFSIEVILSLSLHFLSPKLLPEMIPQVQLLRQHKGYFAKALLSRRKNETI